MVVIVGEQRNVCGRRRKVAYHFNVQGQLLLITATGERNRQFYLVIARGNSGRYIHSERFNIFRTAVTDIVNAKKGVGDIPFIGCAGVV